MGLRDLFRQVPGARWACRRWRRLLGPAGPEGRNERYDAQTAAVMARALRRDSVCVDGGAHRGSLLRQMLRHAPAGRHHAFEPLPHLARRLRARFPGVVVHQQALAEVSGESAFTFVANDPGYSGLRRRNYDRPGRVTRELRVATCRLDDALPPGCPVALIKLDLEGGEYHALRGARETVRRCRPLVIFEFGMGAADFYGVTPDLMWDLVVGELALALTTMARWLAGAAPLSRADFRAAYLGHSDFYFLAAPAGRPA
jgi:FkbM family methyltransferase